VSDISEIGNRPPGLRIHPRTMMVQIAEAEFDVAVLQFLDSHDHLTDVELAGIMLRAVRYPLKQLLRAERHPDDPERKADEE
jgi:hypothetical protein